MVRKDIQLLRLLCSQGTLDQIKIVMPIVMADLREAYGTGSYIALKALLRAAEILAAEELSPKEVKVMSWLVEALTEEVRIEALTEEVRKGEV